MTHDDLLKIAKREWDKHKPYISALHAVIELHKPVSDTMHFCMECKSQYNGESDVVAWPCPTLQAIKTELVSKPLSQQLLNFVMYNLCEDDRLATVEKRQILQEAIDIVKKVEELG